MKYKAVRLISLQMVYEAGDKDSMEFREVFDGLFRWCFRQWGMTMQFFAAIDFNVLGPLLESRPKWRDFLLGGGFIEKVEEPFYSTGDHFIRKGWDGAYLLAYVGDGGLVQLIRMSGKGYYVPPVRVGNMGRITEEEFREITAGNMRFFIKIEEEKC